MIDFHSHILHGIDDGSKSLDESMALVEDLISQRVFDVVCTPHFYPDEISLDEFLLKRDASLEALRNSCAALPDFRLYAGAEVYCSEFLEICHDISPLCIQGTALIMIEMPVTRKWPDEVWRILDIIINKHGLQIIIAHAERYPQVIKHPKSTFKKLIDLGCMIQVNCDAFIDKSSQSRVLKWLDKGFVHLLGTDCHNTTTRPPRMDKALEVITDQCGEGVALTLQNNAQKLLSGEPLKGSNLIF